MEKTSRRKSATVASVKVKKTSAAQDDKAKIAKRPMSAFFFYSQHLRDEIKKNGGSVSGVENVAKMAGMKWKELSDNDKKPFVEKSNADKKRYEKELASGLKAPARKTKSSKATHDKVKDPNKPKRAQSAYVYYLADFRKSPEAVNIKHTDIMKVAATKWKGMSNDQKKPYLELEKGDKVRFSKEMESYKSAPAASSKKSGGKQLKKIVMVAKKAPSESEEDDDDDDNEGDEDNSSGEDESSE